MADDVREALKVDVLYVGAGPANLASAYRLAKLIEAHNSTAATPISPMIAIIEKSEDIGQHILSGAVLDPRALEELIPDFRDAGAPFDTPVSRDHLWYLTQGGGFSVPVIPPIMRNSGKYVVSLSDVTRWLAEKVTQMGVQIYPGFPGTALLYGDNGEVTGVRTGHKGIDREGNKKPNFEPGIDIMAKVTLLGEGSRGSLCKQLFAEKQMHGENPQVYGVGVKELWEIPEGRVEPGTVIHTMGWPLRSEEFGGGFIYALSSTELIVGLVIGLDYRDPFLDPQARLQQLKQNGRIRPLLEGGKLLKFGAATLPEGGYFAMPQLYNDGVLITGDSGGFLNGMRLKGIHLGMKSGMLAAETVLESLLRKDSSCTVLSKYADRFEASWAKDELWSARNFHQAFQGGLCGGLLHSGLQMISGGRGLKDRWYAPAGHEHMQTVGDYYGQPYAVPRADGDTPSEGIAPTPFVADGELTFDKLTAVYHSDTGHEENQPCHLVITDTDICRTRCTHEYGNPCQHFCPAGVYEWLPGEDTGGQEFRINASNCVHCKTCDIMDPYQVIDWVTPEGGGGPNFSRM
ncbi:electron transfer flavoprotein-ubiquinone oxidoreductase [bacterium]|nr:MAG: electron transfer flavoprotein-ubiquinone oxidoreductase [bacterium]